MLRLRWKIAAMKEQALLFAARRIPRRLRYWATIVSIAEATTGEYSGTIVPDLSAMEMLKRIEPKPT
jgi:hypothetical protein